MGASLLHILPGPPMLTRLRAVCRWQSSTPSLGPCPRDGGFWLSGQWMEGTLRRQASPQGFAVPRGYGASVTSMPMDGEGKAGSPGGARGVQLALTEPEGFEYVSPGRSSPGYPPPAAEKP